MNFQNLTELIGKEQEEWNCNKCYKNEAK